MKRAATKSKVTTPSAKGGLERLEKIAFAKQQFMDTALNMSWQLAITIIVPVVIGVKLDEHFNSSPSWTLAALFVAIFAAASVVWKTLRNVAKLQAKPGNKEENK